MSFCSCRSASTRRWAGLGVWCYCGASQAWTLSYTTGAIILLFRCGSRQHWLLTVSPDDKVVIFTSTSASEKVKHQLRGYYGPNYGGQRRPSPGRKLGPAQRNHQGWLWLVRAGSREDSLAPHWSAGKVISLRWSEVTSVIRYWGAQHNYLDTDIHRPNYTCHMSLTYYINVILISSLFQTCPMKGRPEQSFLDTFSERFMNHVRQVRVGQREESVF